MKCQVLKSFVRRGVSQLPGSIIEVPEEMILKMAGYVQPVGNADTYPEQPEDAPEGTNATLAIVPPTHCQARKVGGRICGALLKEGLNGFLSCSDMSCQVPATPHGLKRRGGTGKC